MITQFHALLGPLLQNPALWLCLTLLAYLLGQYLYKLTRFNPLATPIIVAVVTLIVLLLVLNVPYEQYFAGASIIHFLLGPATVVLAVPLFEQRQKLIELWLPLTAGLFAGSITAIVSVIFFGWLFGMSAETMISMIPKSVTTPIAMGVSEAMGGRADLTACLVVITGIFGSIVGRPIFNFCHMTSDPVRGMALGLSAHGMGTSAAFQISNRAGAFAGLAMGLTGIITAFLAPMIGLPLMRALGI